MLNAPSLERRTQLRLRMIITALQADREHRRGQWDKQVQTITVLQHDIASLRREVAKYTRRFT